MKLTGMLKNQVEAAESMEEKKALIADAGTELTDDEVVDVAGGACAHKVPRCVKCQRPFMASLTICPY